MSRALVTLLGGVVLTLLGAAVLTPGTALATQGFTLVLLTVVAGAVVMGVVVRRAGMRDEAERIDALGRELGTTRTRPDEAVTPTDEEDDRG
jgi:hypothetical protein